MVARDSCPCAVDATHAGTAPLTMGLRAERQDELPVAHPSKFYGFLALPVPACSGGSLTREGKALASPLMGSFD